MTEKRELRTFSYLRGAFKPTQEEPDEDEPDEEEPQEPDPEDWTMTDVRGGVAVGSMATGYWDTFPDRDAAEAAIRERMDSEGFWPDVWWISDHGNAHLIDMTK